MPHVIIANISPRCIARRYGRTSSGASIMPTKICTAAASASGPSIPSVRRSTAANAPLIACSTPHWNSSAEIALMTSTSGRILNARISAPPGCVSRNGSGPPPR